ncbi:site-specific integrase [Paracoccus tibetensis]|uniref:Phage integrase family protein n=1 Tax=Paracoccus tibetensis TaxID=336292 RepID=A0A1G5CY19_9RHOB|nr:site-specific integrase [Paracoccus tibetensis]SCY07161.1 Phage integrase family protein [Paracoccus tibetensis]
MPKSLPHLELRPTGFFWRRRVPVAVLPRYSTSVFCFPLKTNLLREAAAVAARITAIADICFRAEIDVPPEVMTRLLVTYARLEIETADRIRALTGPRSRAAAEAALAVEAATRASLRDSLLLCERDPAFRAIESTARHLGLVIEGHDEDLPILADRMMRLMIETSEERERRTRGVFSDRQPYLELALGGLSVTGADAAVSRSDAPAAALQPASHPTCSTAPVPQLAEEQDGGAVAGPATLMTPASGGTPAAILEPISAILDAAAPGDPVKDASGEILYADAEGLVRFTPARCKEDSGEPTLLEIFDSWFEAQAQGIVQQGALQIVDRTVAARFGRNADTTMSTRKILAATIGARRVSELGSADWQNFTTLLLRLPACHGKSLRERGKSYDTLAAEADARDHAARARAAARARKERMTPAQAAALADEGMTPRLSPRTVQRHQMTLASAIDHAVSHGHVTMNTFRPFVLKDRTVAKLKKGAPDTKRKLWGDEFKQLLATKVWNSRKTRIDGALYWAPLIARLHGLRSEEILQLHCDNILSMDGIWIFDILQGTGQSLKSNNARRLIPLHSQLIEPGFLELVAHQRQQGQVRLFPEAVRGRSAKLSYTSNFTKRFTYYRRAQGIYDQHMDFHALRGTFNTFMTGSKTPDTARRYLIGHDNPDVGIKHYLPEGFSLATLRDYIEEQRIDLSMVTRRFAGVRKSRQGPVLAIADGMPVDQPCDARQAS